MCKRFSVEKFYKFGSDWAYLHLIDRSVQVQKQLSTVDLKESCNELKIKILEEEVDDGATPSYDISYKHPSYPPMKIRPSSVPQIDNIGTESVGMRYRVGINLRCVSL